MSNQDIVIPKYSFKEGEEEISPVKRTIFKTMEVTETFNMYDVMKYLAAMDKSIADKQAEIDGLLAMKEAYIKEMSVVEEQLDVTNIEEEFQKAVAEENEKNAPEETTKDAEEIKEDN